MVLSMDRWIGKVAVVTGASAGIGAAIATRLVEEGLQVVGLARRKDRLDELAQKLSSKNGKLFPIKADMSKEEDILDAFRWIKVNLGPVHILVNNAGIFKFQPLLEGDTELWRNVFDVEVIGMCIATREAVRDMKANKVDGHIININGLGGHRVLGLPGINVTSGAKFAVTALTETSRLELNSMKLKIKITSISPGFVDTEAVPGYFPMEKLYKESKVLEPEQIANAVAYVLSTPPHVQIQELTIRPICTFTWEDVQPVASS